jgi:hypothetical protein
MSFWGSVKNAAKKTWRAVKRAAKRVGRAIAGGVSVIRQGLSWLTHRILGIPEFLLSNFGIRFPKKMRVKVVILRDENGNLVATRADVEPVVEEAKSAFKEKLNVNIVAPPREDGVIVSEIEEQNPSYVLTPKCDEGAFKHIFTRVGKWFRSRTTRYSARGGSTVFVVKDVLGGKAGCYIGPFADFGYIDPDALRDSSGAPVTGGHKLTFAHELLHACDLGHRENEPFNFMHPSGEKRTRFLDDWQIAVARSSPCVRYF